ncbi:hypothetical protein N7490_006499 [Penicillium lividum]|nr:hypothetical protein N7490_006499 [Penicillium lividum]
MPKAWRSFLYIHLSTVFRHLDIAEFHQALTIAILFTANIVVLTYGAESWTAAQRRAGSLAIIHIIPLCPGINFGFPADLLHLDRQVLAWFHRWIGRICVLHALLHGSLVVSIARISILAIPSHLIPMIGGQFALKSHYVLMAIAISGIAYHLVQRRSAYRWVLLGAISLWLVCSLSVCMRVIFTRRQSQAVISTCDGTLWLDITLPLKRTVRSGQYMQLWMPSAGFRAFMQLPLFYVVICECDDPSGEPTARMVARPQPGVTSNLYRIAKDSPKRQSVKLLGPYGRPLDLSRFGTIVFVLEDIGLFRALSYIKMLVEASQKREVMVRRLDILWQRDETFEDPPWFETWRQQLLDLDWQGFDILLFRIYSSRAGPGHIPLVPDERGKRLWYYDRAANFEEEITQYLVNQHGEMAVADLGPYHTWAEDQTLPKRPSS